MHFKGKPKHLKNHNKGFGLTTETAQPIKNSTNKLNFKTGGT